MRYTKDLLNKTALLQWRTLNNMTVMQLATKTQIPAHFLKRYEQRLRLMDETHAKKLAKFFGCELDERGRLPKPPGLDLVIDGHLRADKGDMDSGSSVSPSSTSMS